MPKFRELSLGARVLTVSAVGMLLSFGLCGIFGTWDSVGATRFSDAAISAGMTLFWISGLGLLLGTILLSLRRRDKR